MATLPAGARALFADLGALFAVARDVRVAVGLERLLELSPFPIMLR